ncbi:hypothetical protein [Alteromonas sp. a30]|uniref:hypothetical protein n=1 Tax=Alteromonas sp. a30 TaxID=2730917 RepID=UPI00227FE8B3|nr:hypothetical protein [Alteromonas sp. a30]MCY7295196.1 hypothetical protein [Alteromonas sp. a30]
MKTVIAITLAVLLSACASSPYTYHVEPTPILKQKTPYKVSQVSVNLTLGHGAIEGDTTFANKTELESQFRNYLEASLKEKGLLAAENTEGLSVSFSIDFKRRFHLGGGALGKPEVSHSVVIQDGDKALASFGKRNYTTKYAYLEDLAVNLEIAAFSWDQEDEPRDIELISKLIVEELINAGK